MTFDKHEYQKAKTYTHELQVNHKKYLDTLKYDFLNRCSNPPICTKSPEDFDKVQTLASGSFGTVFLVRDTCTFEYHAMKAIEKAEVVRKRSTKQLHLEKKILQSIQFPFVMSVDFCCKDNLYVYFILPYEAGGELYSLIKKLGPFSEILMQFYSAQIVLALEYLHNCSIIHRDLKPENILLNESGYLKLGDFGFSKILKARTWTLCGTPEYLAPEIILSKGYTFSVDWWALGVLIYEMSAAYPPFYNSNPIKLYEKVLGGQFKTPECMTPVCKSLVKNLLEVDPTKRYGSLKAGVYDIKSHQWFRDINWQSILWQKIIPPYIPVCRSSGDTANFAYVSDTKLKRCSTCLYEQEFENF
ncbi:cAMP-dependent protein kinase catalytic subunit 1-like [Manduca sexta]|uniref:cAMP-dependent protein kinase catalytic subunit 1-like n=1 Tax=Manduca sexta TaxID=7130 RepID=UPI0018902C28|nr:cAMP-dependent protein kinase catalytic subunit 1-like [Manduca sexta]